MRYRKSVILKFISFSIFALFALSSCSSGSSDKNTDDEQTDSEDAVSELLAKYSKDDQDFYLHLAEFAVNDLKNNWWLDNKDPNHFKPTWGGEYPSKYDSRGIMWERAMLNYSVYNMWKLTGSSTYEDMLVSEAKWIRANFDSSDLDSPSGLSGPATDDCSWSTMLYLRLYEVTKDEWFLTLAETLLDNVDETFYNTELGFMEYNTGLGKMSLYEVGLTLSWFRLWEITGEQKYYDRSLQSYNELQDHLGTDEGLYFVEADAQGPLSSTMYIEEASSASFLAGNMGMAAMSAKLYKKTNESKYLDRMAATIDAIVANYDRNGVLLNDRDAFTEGTFVYPFVCYALPLSNNDNMRQLLEATAYSIITKDRTINGYYGGSWQGPATGSGSIWYTKGSTPVLSMVTGSTVMMVTAAALAHEMYVNGKL